MNNSEVENIFKRDGKIFFVYFDNESYNKDYDYWKKFNDIRVNGEFNGVVYSITLTRT